MHNVPRRCFSLFLHFSLSFSPPSLMQSRHSHVPKRTHVCERAVQYRSIHGIAWREKTLIDLPCHLDRFSTPKICCQGEQSQRISPRRSEKKLRHFVSDIICQREKSAFLVSCVSKSMHVWKWLRKRRRGESWVLVSARVMLIWVVGGNLWPNLLRKIYYVKTKH